MRKIYYDSANSRYFLPQHMELYLEKDTIIAGDTAIIPKTEKTQGWIDGQVKKKTMQICPISEYAPNYASKRCMNKVEGGYGTIEEQLEMIYDKIKENGGDAIAGLQAWYDYQTSVKANHPKE